MKKSLKTAAESEGLSKQQSNPLPTCSLTKARFCRFIAEQARNSVTLQRVVRAGAQPPTPLSHERNLSTREENVWLFASL